MSERTDQVTLGHVVDLLESWYPPRTAEPWDKVGLVVGDPAQPVTSILCTVDVTLPVVRQAVADGVDLIVAHHPLLLRGVHAVTATDPKGAMVLELARAGIGLWAGHTNADIAHDGVGQALAEAFGLRDTTPMAERPGQGLDNLVTFVPPEDAAAVVEALTRAGAGTVGDYDSCHFATEGTGSFRPLEGANPYIGEVGTVEHTPEVRLEMVAPRAHRRAVVQALLEAHPYETPAWHIVETAAEPTEVGLGKVGRVEPQTLGEFTQHIAQVIPATATGVRLAGDPDRRIERVAILPGAGDSLLDTARGLGVDCYVTSDLRHHPAGEFIEWSHLDDSAPALIDIAHWAAEWMWLPLLADKLHTALGSDAADPNGVPSGAEESRAGVVVDVCQINTDPWTQRYDKQ